MPNLFDTLFDKYIHPLLQSPETIPEAIESLQDAFREMPTDFERSEVYHWLARLHNVLASEAIKAGEIERAKEHHALVEEFYVKALDEYQPRPQTRLALARYYLAPENRPDLALQLLSADAFPSFETEDDPDGMLAFYEHQRRGLLGACFALQEDLKSAVPLLKKAYGEDLRGRFEGHADLSPLKHMALCNVRMPLETIKEIADEALKFDEVENADVRPLINKIGGLLPE